MSEKFRVDLAGLGVMGQVHFGCYKNNPNCEIVVADTDAAKLKGDAVAGNIVGASALDLTGIRALQAGKHVLRGKPMARTVAECEEMITATQKSGNFLMFGHYRTPHPRRDRGDGRNNNRIKAEIKRFEYSILSTRTFCYA